MAKVQHNRATAASILQIGFFCNAKCARRTVFAETVTYNKPNKLNNLIKKLTNAYI